MTSGYTQSISARLTLGAHANRSLLLSNKGTVCYFLTQPPRCFVTQKMDCFGYSDSVIHIMDLACALSEVDCEWGMKARCYRCALRNDNKGYSDSGMWTYERQGEGLSKCFLVENKQANGRQYRGAPCTSEPAKIKIIKHYSSREQFK